MAMTMADAVRVLTEERDELRGVLRESSELKYTVNEVHVNERIEALTHIITLLDTHRLVPNKDAARYAKLWLEEDKHIGAVIERETLERGFAVAWRHLLEESVRHG
jgi:hypothetical protein